MNEGQAAGTLDVQVHKPRKVEDAIREILERALDMLASGTLNFTADDIDLDKFGPDDRNVIGTAFTALSHMKHAIILPVMTSDGTMQQRRRSAKDQAHGNALRVWSLHPDNARHWLNAHPASRASAWREDLFGTAGEDRSPL